MPFPWAAQYDAAVPLALEPPAQAAPWLLQQAALRSPAAPALDFLGRTYTYGQLDDAAARAAQGLKQLGDRKSVV